MIITVNFYGAFRAFGKQVSLNLEPQASVQTIKRVLIEHLGEEQKNLVEDSVFANEADILQDNFIIANTCTLSILPPVCGG